MPPPVRNGEERERTFGVLSISIAIHAFFFVGLGFSPAADGASFRNVLDFEVLQTKEPEVEGEQPAKEEPEPEPEKPKKQPEPRAPAPKPRAARNPAEPPVEQPPENPKPWEPADQQPEPVDFPGLTLTAEGAGSSWTTAVGSGAPIRAPVVVPKPRKTRAVLTGTGGSGGGETRKPRKKLARPPQQPPDMDATLLRFYPRQARVQGIEGLAVMKVVIARNGQTSDIRLVRETYQGFGDACRKTLRSARWKPKLDNNGRPVPVEITYTCRFEVGY